MNIDNFRRFFSDFEKNGIQKHADAIFERMNEFALKQMEDDSELDYQDACNQFFIIALAEKMFQEHCSVLNS